MYCVGNLPDHVTRYTHKNQSRWMVMVAPPTRVSVWGVVEKAAMALAYTAIVATMIAAAVLALQGVI